MFMHFCLYISELVFSLSHSSTILNAFCLLKTELFRTLNEDSIKFDVLSFSRLQLDNHEFGQFCGFGSGLGHI